MSAEKIIEKIKKDSQRKTQEIINDAEQQAEEIKQKAKDEAKKQAEQIISNGEKKSKNIERINESKANQENKKKILDAKEEIINQCFQKAKEKLADLTEEEYKKIVKSYIENGKKQLDDNAKAWISRDVDKKIVEQEDIEVEKKIDAIGGIILKSADGKLTLDYTFENILQRDKDRLRVKIGKKLFS
ncbi:MAG: V-type ATP synthase subunit E family protein [Candidatus Thermoplasmatota archaeon]